MNLSGVIVREMCINIGTIAGRKRGDSAVVRAKSIGGVYVGAKNRNLVEGGEYIQLRPLIHYIHHR
jgi:hypothetical protein